MAHGSIDLNALGRDLRHAGRGLLRKPGFALSVMLSLAVGVGANAAVFTVASALLLRPLPYADAERLVILWNRSPGIGILEDWFSTAQYFDIKTGHQGFEQVAIAIGANANLTGVGEPERVGTLRVSSNLLPMLGARAAVGRLFTAADDVPGTTGAAVLGHATWTRRYGGDPGAIGRTVVLNGQPYEIVGVLEEGFDVPREVMPTLGVAEHADVVLPLPLDAEAPGVRNREDYNIVGKLEPGVSAAQAQTEMDAITARLRRDHPEFYPPNGGLTFSVVPLHEQVVGDVRTALLILGAAVAFVLLIACVNVALLLLARAASREREVAVRSVLGASRGRILRELLAESLLLAAGGGLVGLLLCLASVRALSVFATASVPRLHEVAVDGRVLALHRRRHRVLRAALRAHPGMAALPAGAQGGARRGPARLLGNGRGFLAPQPAAAAPRGRRARALRGAPRGRGPPRPQLRPRARRPSGLQSRERPHVRAHAHGTAVRRSPGRDRDVPAAVGTRVGTARRRRRRRSLRTSPEPDDGVGSDHRGRADPGAGRGVHQHRHPRGGRRLLPRDGDPASLRPASSASTTREPRTG